MAFTSIVSGTKTYVPRAPGVYVESTLGFNSPKDEVRITGATRNKDKTISGSRTHMLEKDVTVNGIVTRVRAIVTTTYYLDPAFTTTEIQNLSKVGYDFEQTSGYLNRLLQGES